MLLKNKSAVIYGASGAIGGAAAHAFAREGATVFLAGRTRSRLDEVAAAISAAGGKAHVAPVDALDAEAVEQHATEIVQVAGSIDISFNVIGLGDAQGVPLVAITPEHFALPIETAMRTHLITTTTAARHMVKQGSGVILALTAQAARTPYPNVGGFGIAGAAIEALCRQLALELGPQGIRVVCLRSAGSPDTPGVAEAWGRHAESAGMTYEAWTGRMAEKTLLKRLPLLADVANVAVLVASEQASAITGAIVNVTCGELID